MIGMTHDEHRGGYGFAGETDGYEALLTPEALDFLGELHRRFEPERQARLAARRERQARFDAGELPDFLPETREIRESDWRVGPIPPDLQDRRVEITGPVERKMIINALNSGAKVFMADFEDSHAPTWRGTLDGQVNLIDAARGDIALVTADGRRYALRDETATLMVRPRGWHLDEKHFLVDGAPMSGALFDFGLNLFHTARLLIHAGHGPYYYLPKLESHHEARLWNAVIDFAEDRLGLDRGTVKVTVLIETLPAVFEMHEILHALREHVVGLNCGRWDYIFSYIKTLRAHGDRLLPERGQVTMTTRFLRSYSRLLIQTCHRRGAFAMGGMAAQIPVRDDPGANERALDKVRADKEREVADGHDGTWVAHPGLIPIARAVFDAHMPGPNQLDRRLEDLAITREDLLAVPEGTITAAGLRNNVEVAIEYLAAWLGGNGCVPIHHLMEDAATAEIARTQLWQWLQHGGRLDDGEAIDADLLRRLLEEETESLALRAGDAPQAGERYRRAAQIVEAAVFTEQPPEFITTIAYERLP